eukprot:1990562-Rhodomonas_salina.5
MAASVHHDSGKGKEKHASRMVEPEWWWWNAKAQTNNWAKARFLASQRSERYERRLAARAQLSGKGKGKRVCIKVVSLPAGAGDTGADMSTHKGSTERGEREEREGQE